MEIVLCVVCSNVHVLVGSDGGLSVHVHSRGKEDAFVPLLGFRPGHAPLGRDRNSPAQTCGRPCDLQPRSGRSQCCELVGLRRQRRGRGEVTQRRCSCAIFASLRIVQQQHDEGDMSADVVLQTSAGHCRTNTIL